MADHETDAAIARMRALADLYDTRFSIPGTSVRFGLDAIIGLIPGVGDALSAGLSTLIFVEAARAGVSGLTLVRMGVNTLIDTVLGAVPIVGDLFDVAYRANARNARLATKDLEKRRRRA